jgi:N-alpha-acetyltransferase 40
MSLLEGVAERIPGVDKVMLTCFLSNSKGLEFYRRLGFEKAAHSPETRRLRSGKMFVPDYLIMSKDVGKRSYPGVTLDHANVETVGSEVK